MNLYLEYNHKLTSDSWNIDIWDFFDKPKSIFKKCSL